MARLTLVHSFLDRFEQRLEVECEQLKRQLLAQVDQQFGVLRSKVAEIRSQFGGTHSGTVTINPWIDDPPAETVALDLCIREQLEQQQHAHLVNQQSTSTGRKRKLPSTQTGGVKKRTAQASANASNRKHVCKFVGCFKSFDYDNALAVHERIHLGIKPYSCTWPDCKYDSELRPNVVQHIRSVHFKLPSTVKMQNELNIEDDRDPNEFVRVDQQLASRRL